MVTVESFLCTSIQISDIPLSVYTFDIARGGKGRLVWNEKLRLRLRAGTRILQRGGGGERSGRFRRIGVRDRVSEINRVPSGSPRVSGIRRQKCPRQTARRFLTSGTRHICRAGQIDIEHVRRKRYNPHSAETSV